MATGFPSVIGLPSFTVARPGRCPTSRETDSAFSRMVAGCPRVLRATPEERQRVRLSSRGPHWDALDEDVSVAGLLTGLGDLRSDKSFAA